MIDPVPPPATTTSAASSADLIEALARAIVADWNMHAPRHTITFLQTHFLKDRTHNAQ